MSEPRDAERERLDEDDRRLRNWKRWGPYLAERQWGTVREDYSGNGDVWGYLTHDAARSRAYRWGEDGLMGICDRQGRLCFALACWNGRDPILKERLFGLANPEGNHGEDVKELYFYLDAVPTSSYLKGLYRYPHAAFPYRELVEGNRSRSRKEPELEILDTGVFEGERYCDVVVEYAKASTDDVLIRIALDNRGPEAQDIWVLPTLWFRNTWSWGRSGEGYWPKPRIARSDSGMLDVLQASLGHFKLAGQEPGAARAWTAVFTENETNNQRLYGTANASAYVKDAFHRYLVEGERAAVNPAEVGTKAAWIAALRLEPGEGQVLRLRLSRADEMPAEPFGEAFEETFQARRAEADRFYAGIVPGELSAAERQVARQAYAGLMWTKQFYHYVVKDWLEGDPAQPAPPVERASGRNGEWTHLYNRDVIAMPDKWEYPWYASWDLAFHVVAMARQDPVFAKHQLVLFLREWYTHPNGQLPAYEFSLSDANPPVHAWATWRLYKMTGPRGQRDTLFLARVFQKLLINFTWWVNRKDLDGHNLFTGGFLGLDNIGVFDRSKPLPSGGHLEQADGTAWMAFYCLTMLSMALELAQTQPAAEDLASKFFEHFVAIVDAMNTLGGTGLWDEHDGFYYDRLHVQGEAHPMRVRSLVGLIPLLAVEVLQQAQVEKLAGFTKRMRWFLENRSDLARHIAYLERDRESHRLLAIPSRERLVRVLGYLLDENEFLSPFGVRSLSRVHAERPYSLSLNGHEHRVDYEPGEAEGSMFGGNSNWRGPVWFPVNYLLIEALERYHYFYGESFKVECPTGSGRLVTLKEVAREIDRRLVSLFLPDAQGARPCHAGEMRYGLHPNWKDLILFHEYFHAETGRGLGASHQTGWTALVVRSLENLARERSPRRLEEPFL